MIPQLNITAWSRVAPWPEPRQVEQDLIISRALVDIFSDEMLRKTLRFRGGTALNKLHFPAPLRYSEDIDLVRTEHGPIGPILDQLRQVLQPWLGIARFEQSQMAPKFTFKAPAEDNPEIAIKLKLEINTHEVEAYDGAVELPMAVDNPWFTGETTIPTFSREEMMATKLRALLQRRKGRDLFDLSHALEVFDDLDLDKVIEIFLRYLERHEEQIPRAEAERRMFAKLAQPAFMQDMRPLLPASALDGHTPEKNLAAFSAVFRAFIWRVPGASWQKTAEMAARFNTPDLVT